MEAVIELVDVQLLRHIEDFDPERVAWLVDNIMSDGVWTTPLALDSEHYLVLDGQHRMEAAKSLGLRVVPAVKFDYSTLTVNAMRPGFTFTWRDVVDRALAGEIYPYKTVKHGLDGLLPDTTYPLDALR